MWYNNISCFFFFSTLWHFCYIWPHFFKNLIVSSLKLMTGDFSPNYHVVVDRLPTDVEMKLQLDLIRFNLGEAPATQQGRWERKPLGCLICIMKGGDEDNKVGAQWWCRGKQSSVAPTNQGVGGAATRLHLPHIEWERIEWRGRESCRGGKWNERSATRRPGREKEGTREGMWGWDVTESNVCSSDFTVYWSRKRWTLDEIFIRCEKNSEGMEEIRG